MILTIQAPNKAKMNQGLWQCVMLGIEAEPFADNTFEISVGDSSKADHIISSCDGRVIHQESSRYL